VGIRFGQDRTIGLVLSAIFAILFANSAYAREKSNVGRCEEITKSKTPKAFLLNKDGTNSPAGFDLGLMDIAASKENVDYFFSPSEYFLILTPKTRTFEGVCSLSLCVETRKVNPRCKGTAEYAIRFGIAPSKYGPGEFSDEIDLNIDDTSAGEHGDIKTEFHFNKRVNGSLALARLKVRSPPDVENNLSKLLNSSIEKVTLRIENTGNRPTTLGRWENFLEKNSENIQLRDISCAGKSISPAGYCEVEIHRPKMPKSDNKLISWMISAQGNFSYILSLERFDNGTVSATIQNK
jgi:hypothetical protein